MAFPVCQTKTQDRSFRLFCIRTPSFAIGNLPQPQNRSISIWRLDNALHLWGFDGIKLSLKHWKPTDD